LSGDYSFPGTEAPPQKYVHPVHPEMSCKVKVGQKPENDPSNRSKINPEHNGTRRTQVKS